MRLFLAAVISVGILAIGLFTANRKVEIFRDSKVRAGVRQRLLSDLLPHISKPQYIEVFGSTYWGIRGMKPYYLELTNSESILFVTENPRENVVIHIVDLKTEGHREIGGNGSGFGWAIGSGRSAGEQGSDYIEVVDSNKIALVNRALNWKHVSVLNLSSAIVEREEIFDYDHLGVITNHAVFSK